MNPSRRIGALGAALLLVACGRVRLGSFGIAGDAGGRGGAGNAGGSGASGSDASAGAGPDDAGNLGADASPTPSVATPSCQGTAERCGVAEDSCCTSLPVEGGTVNVPTREQTTVPVTVSSFSLDEYEVTVGRFRQFLAGYDAWRGLGNPQPGAGSHSHIADSGWRAEYAAALPVDSAEFEQRLRDCSLLPYSTWDRPGSANIPLNCVSWFEAFAFCAWDEARLPTYSEWTYAAAGGAANRTYPWGDGPVPSRDRALYGCSLSTDQPECTIADVLPVGSLPLGGGAYGQQDLAGSMSEWVLDSLPGPESACTDCANVGSSESHASCGGSWTDGADKLVNLQSDAFAPATRIWFIGLRCARNLAL